MTDPVSHCPKCQSVELVAEDYDGLTLERCPRCFGMLMTESDLKALLERKMGTALDPRGHTGVSLRMNRVPAHCPSCDRSMQRAGTLGVMVDFCLDCRRMFLDAGEFRKIEQATTGSPG